MKTTYRLFIYIIIFTLLPTILVRADSNMVYVVNLEYSYGKINMENVYVRSGNISIKLEKVGDYRYELISFNNEVLYTSQFDIKTSFIAPPPIGWEGTNQTVELEELSFTLTVPYFEDGKTINIYNPENDKVLSVDVGYFVIEKEKTRKIYYLIGGMVILIVIGVSVYFYLKRKFSTKIC